VRDPAEVSTIGVIGAGSWGTALAKLLAESDHDVTVWAHSSEVSRTMEERRENVTYLPGFRLPENLRATSALSEAVAGKEMLVSVSPSHVVRRVMSDAVRHMSGTPYIVSASKGVEEESLLTMAGVLEQVVQRGRGGKLAHDGRCARAGRRRKAGQAHLRAFGP
jgi:glycerol-3-phosphate dehydrogenase (NAD(P)+)